MDPDWISSDDLYDLATMLPATAREAARRFTDATAYVAPDGWSLSYGELDRMSDEVAVELSRRGLAAGDVLALVLPPSPEYPVAYLAAAKLGAITTGVNDRLTIAERAALLEHARARLVLADPTLVPEGVANLVAVPAARGPYTMLRELRASGETPPVLPDDPERRVAIVFTSGTTGVPKGALYCNRQLAFITRTDVGDTWGIGGRSAIGTPMAHLGFMTKLPGNLRRGGTSFIMRRWRAADALQLAAEHRMTTVAGVPTQLALMLREPDFDTYDLESVRFLVVGGGPITPGLAREARSRFRAALATRYSCTEAGIGLGTAFDDPEEDAVVSVGRPHPAIDLAVLDDDDRPVAVGEIGQVCVFPVEVEAVLSSHPAVAAVAISPVADPVMGEIGVAVVVARDAAAPPSLPDLREFAAPHLAPYKLPEALIIVEALPLTAMEKVDRGALREVVTDSGQPIR